MTLRDYDRTAHDLADAMQLSHKEAAEWAARLHALKHARILLEGGEVMSISVAAAEEKKLTEALRQYLAAHDGRLEVEGLPPLYLQQRSGSWWWDVKSMRANAHATFDRLCEMGALTVDTKIAFALEEKGQITSIRGYGHQSASTPALQWEKRK